ncbi:MAG TPA: YfhO family protein [Terriglobia bacterium]|jgi:hypothetical protein
MRRTTETEEVFSYSDDSQIRKGRREGLFLLLAFGGFIALALGTNYPVLRGKVPFARDLVTQFPPWTGASYPDTTHHAEVGDSVTLFYPWRVFQEAALRRGEFPLWNPAILAGTPFLAEAQSALFYPIHLLLFLMYPPTFWTFNLLLNLALSGFFTVLFLRSIGASRSGAFAAGIIFSCCGFLAAWQSFSSLADTAIWLPCILWTVNRLCSRPSIGYMIVSAFAFAMPVLAGHPETALHVILMASAFAIWQCIAIGWKKGPAGRLLLWFTATGLLSLGLTAVQLLPTLEWIPLLPYSLALHWPPLQTRSILAFFSRDLLANPNSAGLLIPENAAYVAPIAFLLAPLSLFTRNRRSAWFLVLAGALGTCTVYGWWPVHSIVDHIPMLAGVRNGRMLLLVDFSLAGLAGLGITALESELSAITISRRWMWSAIAIPLAFAAACIWRIAISTGSVVPALRGPESTALFLILGFVLIALRITNALNARPFFCLLLLLLAVDLGTFRTGILPFARRSEIFPKAPTFDFFKAHADPYRFRVAALDSTYINNAEMIYGLAAVNGYDMTLVRFKNFLADLEEPATHTITLIAKSVANAPDRRMDLLNVKYLVGTPWNDSYAALNGRPDRFKLVFSDGPVSVFENLNVLPRSFFVPASKGSIEVQPDEQRELLRLKDPSFDPEKSVILQALPPSLAGAYTQNGVTVPDVPNAVSIVSGRTNGMDLAVENAQPGVLIVSQTFYPGWLAVVDGEETAVVPADYALVGIPLRPGAHTIKLEFRPLSFRIGLIISVLSILLAAGLLVGRTTALRRRRHRAAEEES